MKPKLSSNVESPTGINLDRVQGLVLDMEKSLVGHEMREIFASYSVMSLDRKTQGFGNIVSRFYPEAYKDKGIAQFILDLEKSIEMALESLNKTKYEVKVLFFR